VNLTFIDTNVLVYANDPAEGPKYRTAIAVLDKLWRDGTGVLSTQVLQEFYRAATQKMRPPMSPEDARRLIADYGEWCSVHTDPLMLISASLLQQRHKLHWWDALIIEAAMRSGATTLLSEDMQDGQKFGTLTVRNPFVETD
jgi:predicted nucleic acid-binding protein